jgi:integrase
MTRRAKTWSYSVGNRRDKIGGGVTVRVYEREGGGVIYLALWDPEARDGAGGYRRLSLATTDRAAARKRADDAYAEITTGRRASLNRAPTIGAIIDGYLKHECQAMADGTLRWLPPALESWKNFLGADTAADDVGQREWTDYVRLRMAGAIDNRGQPVPAGAPRRPVKPGTVRLALDAIMAAFHWAETFRIDNKRRMLAENPFKGLKYPDDPNVSRSIWTHDRFEKVLAAAETLTMQVEWYGRRRPVPCCLADVMVIAEETGRRIGAVRQLRVSDLKLSDMTEGAPHGVIEWPAATDKKRKAWRGPISRNLRERLLKILRSREAVGGDGYLFPAPRSASQPVGRETLAVFLRKALAAAGLPRLEFEAFHGLRRKWATERKHLPERDVAQAGGWRSPSVMKRAYQQADDVGVLEAVLSPRRIRRAEA